MGTELSWSRDMFRHLVLVLVIALASCTRAPDGVGVDTAVPTASVPNLKRQTVFVATSRAPSQDSAEFFSRDRAYGLSFASVDVTIPPNHVPGRVERTKRLPPDPRRHFTIENPINFTMESEFSRQLSRELMARPPQDRNVLLFIHGYNTTLTDGVLQLAQFVEDSGYSGVPILFSWASGGSFAQYAYDVNSVLVARDNLASMLSVMENTNIAHYDVLAHSMGSLLMMEVARQASITVGINSTGKARNVVMAAPDIDIDLFITQLARIPKKYRSFIVLVSNDDRALKASRRVAGGVTRVGAAPAEMLSKLGVVAIDLSKINDQQSISHSKFRGSPAVVQLIGNGLENKSTFGADHETASGGILRRSVGGILTIFGL